MTSTLPITTLAGGSPVRFALDTASGPVSLRSSSARFKSFRQPVTSFSSFCFGATIPLPVFENTFVPRALVPITAKYTE